MDKMRKKSESLTWRCGFLKYLPKRYSMLISNIFCNALWAVWSSFMEEAAAKGSIA
jgi:hypothetical protein